MSFIFVATIVASSAIAGLVPPEGEPLPTASKMPSAKIFEWSDYAGEKSTAKGRITFEDARENCAAFDSMLDEQGLKACAEATVDDGSVWEATANCHTGDMWTQGQHYKFDGPYEEGFFAGYVSMKDMATGEKVGWDNASGGTYLGTTWRVLCPLVTPYDVIPVNTTYKEGPNDVRMGEIIGHNDSVMFHHEGKGIIVYDSPKDSIAGFIKENTVLFRGWLVPGEWVEGVAFTFKKGCAPAPYHVSGRLDNKYETEYPSMILRGKAPVREGCEVVGYSEDSPNAKLIFDLPMH